VQSLTWKELRALVFAKMKEAFRTKAALRRTWLRDHTAELSGFGMTEDTDIFICKYAISCHCGCSSRGRRSRLGVESAVLKTGPIDNDNKGVAFESRPSRT
jgi:hypothetical protein